MAALAIQKINYTNISFTWFQNLLSHTISIMPPACQECSVRDMQLYLYAKAIIHRHRDQLCSYLKIIIDELEPDGSKLVLGLIPVPTEEFSYRYEYRVVREFVDFFIDAMLPTFLVLGYIYSYASNALSYPRAIEDIKPFIESVDPKIFNRMRKGFMNYLHTQHVDMKFKNMELMRLINYTGCYHHLCKYSRVPKYMTIEAQPGIFLQKLLQDQMNKNESKRKRSARDSDESEEIEEKEMDVGEIPTRQKPRKSRKRELAPPTKRLEIRHGTRLPESFPVRPEQ